MAEIRKVGLRSRFAANNPSAERARRTDDRYEIGRPTARGGVAILSPARQLEHDGAIASAELSTFRSSEPSTGTESMLGGRGSGVKIYVCSP
jgi:hypothetical protein